MRIRRLEERALAFPSDNWEMEYGESRFLSHNRILGSLVGAYYSLALVVLCFNFGLLRPLVAPNLSSRAEEFLLAARQAGVLLALGTIAGLAGMMQLRFSTWFGRRSSAALTRLYLLVGLLASMAIFLMEVGTDASSNGLALAGALAWIFFYVLSLTIATANVGVGLFFGNRA